MKKSFIALAAATVLALSGCAATAEPEPSEPAAAPATSEPTTEPTPSSSPTPKRIEFDGNGTTIPFADLLEAEQVDNAVILMPAAIGASFRIEGVDVEWFVEERFDGGLGGVDVAELEPGVLTVKPLAGYDALKDPKDYIKSADGSIIFTTSAGRFAVDVEGVTP